MLFNALRSLKPALDIDDALLNGIVNQAGSKLAAQHAMNVFI